MSHIAITVFALCAGLVSTLPSSDRGLLSGYHQVFNHDALITDAPTFAPTTEDSDAELDHPWSCGTDLFTMSIAEGTIEHDCPDLKNDVNNCCVAHDDCYDDQLGRDFCDDTFCNCLHNATISSKQCNEDDGPAFCTLVRNFGEGAYVAAGLNTTTVSPDDEDILNGGQNSTDYTEYYDEASTQTHP
uniref:Phospholipase A2 n=1 Tax=Panagrellus redivivus TaxID=6233 RepID=A0A7E4VPT1_PANRE